MSNPWFYLAAFLAQPIVIVGFFAIIDRCFGGMVRKD